MAHLFCTIWINTTKQCFKLQKVGKEINKRELSLQINKLLLEKQYDSHFHYLFQDFIFSREILDGHWKHEIPPGL